VYTQVVHYKLNQYGQVPHEWEAQHLVVIFLTGDQWSLSDKFVCCEVELRWKLKLMPNMRKGRYVMTHLRTLELVNVLVLALCGKNETVRQIWKMYPSMCVMRRLSMSRLVIKVSTIEWCKYDMV